MPIIKASEPLDKKEPIILFMGDQGLGKTSLSFTFENPFHINFDKGVQRSIGRKDVFDPKDWHEVLEVERSGEFKKFKTIIIDTPKAALDDFLVPYVIDLDSRMAQQKYIIQRFGLIGDHFKQFINRLRANGNVIIFIAHAKKDDDGKIIADITGQSYSLIARISEQISYITMVGQRRKIISEPTDSRSCKNPAALPDIDMPHFTDAKWLTFGADIVSMVREKIWGMSEQEREAVEISEKYQELISANQDIAELAGLADNIAELPAYLNIPLIQLLGNKYRDEMYACKDEDIEKFNVIYAEVNNTPPFLKTELKKMAAKHVAKMKWVANPVTTKIEVRAAADPATNA